MFAYALVIYLLSFSTVFATESLPHQVDLEERAAMQDKIQTLVQSLELVPSQHLTLISRLESAQNNNGITTLTQIDLACQIARASLGSDSVASKPVNQTEADANWSEACYATPSCVLLPKSTAEVSKALKIISYLKIKFSVRSGGHSPNPGWSNIDDTGILIDLQRINQFAINSDKSVISLGPGLRWGDVYDALDPYGVSVIGGRIPHVGVGGLILGGGYFHFSGEYGLAADNVKNFEVVLADGTITDANATQNSDLFWALKGGGSNFGVVTQFDLYTIPVQTVWYQVAAYSNDQVPAILDAFVQWQKDGASDLKSTVALIIGLEITTLGLIYSAAAEKPAAFEPFYNLTPAAVAVPPTNGTVKSLTDILGTTFSNAPARHDYRGTATKIDAQLYKDVYKFWREQALSVQAGTGANMTFTLQPIPANLSKVGIARGGNPIGIPQVDHQWWTTLVDWQGANNDDAVRAAPIATTEKWKELGEERGLYFPFVYMNDASRDQNPIAGYGAANVEKLKAVAKKYDPGQIFQTLQNNGFLLSKT